MNKFERLVMVPGHAAFKAEVDDVPDTFRTSEPWVLLPYQKEGKGEQVLYLEHLQSGLIAAAEDPASILVLSGGHTRLEAGKWSEGASYYGAALKIADQLGLTETGVIGRTVVDEKARDSYENVARSYELFTSLTQHEPQEMEVHGFSFKGPRYENHGAVVGVPHLVYVSVNNPQAEALAAAERGESKTRAAFREFPHSEGGILQVKKDERTFPGRKSPLGYSQSHTVATFRDRHGISPSPHSLQLVRS